MIQKSYFFLFILITLSIQVMAQHRWEVQLTPRLNFPTSKVLDQDLRLGNGIEIQLAYKVMPHLLVYTGIDWNQYDSDQDFDEVNINYNTRSVDFGSILVLPFNRSKIDYYVKAGGRIGTITVDEIPNVTKENTDSKLGWILGAGVQIKIFDAWHLNPEFLYRSISGVTDIQGVENTLRINEVSFGVGITYLW